MSCLCKFVPLSPKSASYYFLLDRPAALVGPRASALDCHLMHAYRADGYYARNIQDRNSFFPSPTFLVARFAECKYPRITMRRISTVAKLV